MTRSLDEIMVEREILERNFWKRSDELQDEWDEAMKESEGENHVR